MALLTMALLTMALLTMALLTMALRWLYDGSTYYERFTQISKSWRSERLQLAELLLLVGQVLRQCGTVPLEEADELAADAAQLARRTPPLVRLRGGGA